MAKLWTPVWEHNIESPFMVIVWSVVWKYFENTVIPIMETLLALLREFCSPCFRNHVSPVSGIL